MTKAEYMDMYKSVGAALAVYNELGRGMAEAIYQEALGLEFASRGLAAEREKLLTVAYKGTVLNKTYVADFYYKGIVIELKSVEEVNSDHRAQLFNYLRISGQKMGILFNFGEKSLHTERYLYVPEDDEFVLLNKDNYLDYIVEV